MQLGTVPPASALEKVPTIDVQGNQVTRRAKALAVERNCSNML